MCTRTILRDGALTGVVVLLSLQSPALAQPKNGLGFGIEAVGHRSYFVFHSAPSRTVRGTVRIRSTSGRERVVFLRTTDVDTAATGGLEYGPQDGRPVEAGRWISLERERVVLPPGGAVDVPFHVRIPPTARRGDHFGGIVAYGKRPRPVGAGRSRFRLRFVTRLAIAVQLRLNGGLTRGLEFRGAEVQVAPSGAALALKLASTGNALIPTTKGVVNVLQGGRRLFSRPLRIDAFVPDTEITYPVPWSGRPVQGDYRVEATLRPEGGAPVQVAKDVEFGKKRIKEFKRETGRPAVESRGTSPAMMALLVLVAAIVAAAATARAMLRR